MGTGMTGTEQAEFFLALSKQVRDATRRFDELVSSVLINHARGYPSFVACSRAVCKKIRPDATRDTSETIENAISRGTDVYRWSIMRVITENMIYNIIDL